MAGLLNPKPMLFSGSRRAPKPQGEGLQGVILGLFRGYIGVIQGVYWGYIGYKG